MTAISSTTNQISPANERMYGLSRLVGEWKGKWTGKNQEVSFKVINIRGARAQVEYTHNGRTERGIGKVENGTITFAGVMIGTKDGKTAAMMSSINGVKASALLDKQAAPAADNNLIGSWGGHSEDSNGTASFKVISVNGKEAEVTTTINGETRKGTGIVYKNVIMFGNTQISTNDGKTGNLIFQVGLKSFAVPVTKYPPAGSTSSTVDKLA